MTRSNRPHVDPSFLASIIARMPQSFAATYQMPWSDIDDAIDANERIASPALRTQNDTDNVEDAAIETLDALTTIQRIDRRLQFADRYYTP